MTEIQRIRRWNEHIPLGLAALSLATAATVLAGWLLDISWLQALFPGQVSMKPITAVGLLLASLLLFIAVQPRSGSRIGVRWALEVVLLSLGALALAQHLLGIDLRLDQPLIRAPSDAAFTPSPGRMAPATAIGLMLCALALVADHWQSSTGRASSRTCATLLLLLALRSLPGYAYGAPTLYQDIDSANAMALTTAIVFMALAIGIV